MHESIPAVPMPPPPRGNPRALACFVKKWANSPGGTHKLSKCPGGGDEERGHIARPWYCRLHAQLFSILIQWYQRLNGQQYVLVDFDYISLYFFLTGGSH